MLELLFVLIEIPVLLIIWFVKTMREIAEGNTSSSGATAQQPKEAKQPVKAEKKAELSDKQRYDIIKAILDDSLLVLDRSYDALYNTGEALFSAPEALHCSYFEYKEQYGNKKWRRAWEQALADRFDCQCKLADKGNYYLFGKEM